jgi:alanine racemase
VVKVSHIPDVQQDDEVVLIGRQGDDEISAEEVAAWADTINYEVTTSILPRVTRVYLKSGQVMAEP